MRKVFLFMMVSVDGYFEGEGHSLDWHTVDHEFNQFAIEQMKSVDTFLFGRKTYELFENYWPNALVNKETADDDRMIAKMLFETEKVVFSEKGITPHWNQVRVVSERVEAEVKGIKYGRGREIAIFGSNDLTVNLLKMGLVDELRIMVSPVVLGKGRTLLEGFDRAGHLSLIESRRFASGNVLNIYKVKVFASV